MQRCFNCGSTEKITSDHIPPRNLFPKPYPDNLIKVPCCGRCNQSFSLDDEAFMIFASSNRSRSQAGEWVWKNTAEGSSFKRSAKLLENVRHSVVPIAIVPQMGISEWGIKFPHDRAERYLTRITKGLLAKFYPEVDYSKATFKISQLKVTPEVIEVLKKMAYDSRGNKVFDFWRSIDSSKKEVSIWVYQFFRGLIFSVTVELHGNN